MDIFINVLNLLNIWVTYFIIIKLIAVIKITRNINTEFVPKLSVITAKSAAEIKINKNIIKFE